MVLLLVGMMKDKKIGEEIEVMHIATVECHSFQCLCDGCCLRSDHYYHWCVV
jgi:hypothetical protein